MTSLRSWRASAVALALIMLLPAVMPFVADTARAATTFAEDWETGLSDWTVTSTGASHDCTRGSDGCSLRLHPTIGNEYTTVERALNAPMAGVTSVALRFHGDYPWGNTDTGLTVVLNGGGQLTLSLTEGVYDPNNYVTLHSSGYASSSNFYRWPGGDIWHNFVINVDPAADVAWTEVWDAAGIERLARSNNVAIPAGSDVIESLSFYAVYWSSSHTTTGFNYDTVRVGPIPETASAPRSFQAKGGIEQVTLTWAAPAYSGATPVSNYTVYRGNASGNLSVLATGVTDLTYVDTGLAAGATYFYVVAAVNANGTGAPSPERKATTYQFHEDFEDGLDGWTLNGNPGLSATCDVGNPGCSIHFNPPANDVYVTADHNVSIPLSSPTVVTFAFRGSATSGNTDSAFEVHLNDGGALHMDLSHGWASPNTGMRVISHGNGETLFTHWPAANTWYTAVLLIDPAADTVKGELRDANGVIMGSSGTLAIPAGSDAITRLRINAVGWENPTNAWWYDTIRVHNVTTSHPNAMNVVPHSGSTSLSWTAPATSEEPVTGYNLYRKTGSGAFVLHKRLGAVTSYNDGGLTNGVEYCYVVTAVTETQESATSNHDCAVANAVPSAPRDLSGTRYEYEVDLRWMKSEHNGDSAISQYCVYRKDGGTSTYVPLQCVSATSATWYYWTDYTVLPNLGYTYYVTAKNSHGESPPSNLFSVSAV